ncbi:MAG: histidine kinase [Ignavibacteriae bacterium]|nr:histidine kinase [Ignavibacteriota bacterium]
MMKTNIIRNILLFIFCGISISVNSQTFPYYHYTTREGLAYNLVYYALQDKSGYIWFATYGGLSRFDGNTFRNYSMADGLRYNNIVRIAEASDSTLYFTNYREGFNVYKNGIISNYEVTPQNPVGISTTFIKNDTIYFIHNNWEQVSYIYKNKIHTYDSLFAGEYGINDIYPYKHRDSSCTTLLVSNNKGLFAVNTCTGAITKFLKSGNFPNSCIKEDKDNNIWLGFSGKIYRVRDYNAELVLTLDEKIKGDIREMLIDSRGYVWFHPKEKGLFILKNGSITDIGAKLSFGTTEINQIYEDKEGNVWVTTSGKGIYCFYNIFMSNYFEGDGLFHDNIYSLLVNDSGVKFIGTYGGLNIMENNKFERVITGKEFHTTTWITDIQAGRYGNYLISGMYKSSGFSGSYFNKNMFFFPTNVTPCQYDSATFISIDANSKMEIFMSRYNIKHLSAQAEGNLIKYDEKQVLKEFNSSPASPIGISTIERAGDGALWVGTSKGLCKIKGNEETYYKNDSVLNSGIRAIKITPSGLILIAGKKGISVISQTPEKVTSLERTDKFDFSKSASIDIDSDRNIWIGNPKGLFRINYDSLLNGKYNNILYFNDKTALPSYNVQAVSYDKVNNELWVGTEYGLSKMELNSLDKYLNPPPKVLIENIILSDTTLENPAGTDNIVFKPSQNNLRVHYTSFNYSSPKSIKYEHKFEGSNTWSETQYSDAEFFSLPPGKYNLLLRAVNINNLKGEITSLKFEILSPFWKTLWFYFILIVIFLAVIYLVFQKRIRLIKSKADEKIKTQNSISELKHQALSASMNPHFIFNTLNSIQAYMNTHTIEESNEYLVNFSRLIRLNLDLAGQTFIPLETEIQRLELYLSYEKIRFEDRLNYEIKIADNIDRKSLQIPNMILQPFVENSIWHGILHKEEPGNISINISKENLLISQNNVPAITIDILDDGVGLDAIKTVKPSHTSKGISLIKERLRLLAGSAPDFEYIKIRNREKGLPGVSVSITLFPNQYIISA